ncbi:hypothetical protein LY625_01730 [Lysobacter sp. GX 14042]|uniref:hypothetical protein n=1 Tax=Lysobacter sp. GX 14042 TaxID=2907155 RepID=UPI001F185E4B|nr:hypothetical protein [Lysobacter sp. GX 14042]MCE7031357.1 hypothetical protein [Lysobacter sp. GX 14042]
MPRQYVCLEWNDTTQACEGAAWIEQQSAPDWLPTVEQAQTVGGAIFGSLALIAAMSLLLPNRSNNDD